MVDAPDKGTTSGLALAAFILGIVSAYRAGFGYFGSPGTDGWLFAISVIPSVAGLVCAYFARQQIQLGGGEGRDQSFVIAGAILAATGGLATVLVYGRLEQLNSLGF
jgi:hypothetical protein